MVRFRTATARSAAAYKKVAAEHPPQAIDSEQERRYWMGVLNRLMTKPEEELSDAEAVYGRTIALLIEAFEKSRASLPKLAPAEVLVELLSAHNLRQKDLVDIFGSEAAVSYAVNGERNLTVEQIKGLAEKFHVSVAAFF